MPSFGYYLVPMTLTMVGRQFLATNVHHLGLCRTQPPFSPLATTRGSVTSVPVSTYRLQFHAGFTFHDARNLLPYLHSLGITHVYASPLLRARSGSTHGYDVADPNLLNPEIGADADFQDFVQHLHQRDMGLILDIVPNHMGIGDPGNFRWRDVLENGPCSTSTVPEKGRC